MLKRGNNETKQLDEFKKSNCTCKKCVSCCERTPGWFRPHEIEFLAEFLKLSITKAFKQFLIADYWIAEHSNIYVLAPIKDFAQVKGEEKRLVIDSLLKNNDLLKRKCDLPGHRASWSYAFAHAPCVFLKNARCKIYPVRPFECSVSSHDSTNGTHVRGLISKEWSNNRLIETLLNGNKK